MSSKPPLNRKTKVLSTETSPASTSSSSSMFLKVPKQPSVKKAKSKVSTTVSKVMETGPVSNGEEAVVTETEPIVTDIINVESSVESSLTVASPEEPETDLTIVEDNASQSNGISELGPFQDILSLVKKIHDVFDFPKCTSVTKTDKENIKLFADEIKQKIEILMAVRVEQRAQGSQPVAMDGSSNGIQTEVLREILQNQKEMRKEIEQLKTSKKKTEEPRTWANVTASLVHRPECHQTDNGNKRNTEKKHSIIVKANNKSLDTKKVIEIYKSKINAKTLKVGYSNITPLSNKVVRIEFATEEGKEKVKEAVNKTTDLSAEDTRKRRPQIQLKGIHNSVETDEIISIITEQNQAVAEALDGEDVSQHITLKTVLKNRSPFLKNAIFETSPKLYNAILKSGRINLLNQKVYVCHYVPFLQCLKCWGFGHTTKDHQRPETKLPTTDVCCHCAGNHRVKDCPMNGNGTPTCTNCKRSNTKLNKSESTNHRASSLSCPHVDRILKKIIDQTEYEY